MAKDTRTFEDVVKSIVTAEADVDTILKAARLERHGRSCLTSDQRFYLLVLVVALIAFLVFIGLLTVPNMIVKLAKLR